MADMQKIMELKAKAFDIMNQMNLFDAEKQKLINGYNELVKEIDNLSREFQNEQKMQEFDKKLEEAGNIQKESKVIDIKKNKENSENAE